jgi:hypothetical protein
MYFENAGHLGGVSEDDKQRISMTLLKFPVCFGDVFLSDPAEMSGFGSQGTVRNITCIFDLTNAFAVLS